MKIAKQVQADQVGDKAGLVRGKSYFEGRQQAQAAQQMRQQDQQIQSWMQLQIQAAQRGDEQAMLDLCLGFNKVIRRYASRSHLQFLREDAVATGQLAVVQAFKNYDCTTGVPLGAYVEQQVKYAIWNLFKRERKVWQHTVSYDTSKTDEDGTCDVWLDAIADDFELEEAAADDEFQLDFRSRVLLLPQRQQQVLRGLLAGLTLAEIGRIIHISPQAVYQTKIRAQNRLKRAGFRMDRGVGR